MGTDAAQSRSFHFESLSAEPAPRDRRLPEENSRDADSDLIACGQLSDRRTACSARMALDLFALRSQIVPVHSEQIHMVMPLSIHRTVPLRCTREWLAVTGRGWEAHSSSRDHQVIERRRRDSGQAPGTCDPVPQPCSHSGQSHSGQSHSGQSHSGQSRQPDAVSGRIIRLVPSRWLVL
jgi:hypothetical protein